jgi:chromosome partitioning protein
MQDNDPHDVETGLPEKPSQNSREGGDPGSPQPKRGTPWHTLSARVICLVSRKGGVGKTTSAVNLGAALALSGHSVLIVGVDSQCGVARTLGCDPEDLDGGLIDMFERSTPLIHLAYTTPLKNLFFVSPNIRTLAQEEIYLRHMDQQVDTFVSEIDRARNLYDTILIDCPPGLNACTRAALLASQSYLVPVQAEELCRISIPRLLDFIHTFEAAAYAGTAPASPSPSRSGLRLEGLFLTMVSARTRMSRHVTERVSIDHADQLLATCIPRTTRLAEMALRGKPAVIYDRRSAGSRAYFDLMDELIARQTRRCAAAAQKAAAAGRAQERSLAETEPEAMETREAAPARGMEHLLAELRSTPSVSGSFAGEGEAEDVPELVSLDELLAEEEGKAWDDVDWDEPRWGQKREADGRYH